MSPFKRQTPAASGSWGSFSRVTRLSPTILLLTDIVLLLTLAMLLLARFFHWFGIDQLPSVIDGVVPLIVPWAGALGGVSISIVGLANHWTKWGATSVAKETAPRPDLDQRLHFNPWHLTRPWIGAIFGTFGALIVVLVTKVIGATTSGAVDVSPTGAATLATISFVIGYREITFRLLIERVVDTILGPGSTNNTTALFELTPTTLDFKNQDRNSVTDLSVTLKNVGNSALRPSAPKLISQNDAAFSLGTASIGALAVGASEKIVVHFSPTDAKATSIGELSITINGTTKTVPLKGTANP
jgi:hypothetical protein